MLSKISAAVLAMATLSEATQVEKPRQQSSYSSYPSYQAPTRSY